MRLLCLALVLLSSLPVIADPIADANKCWDEKNYQCMVDKYREALTTRQYAEKDYATIQYRMGVGYNKLNRGDDAVKALREAVRMNAAYSLSQWELAYAFFQAKMFDSAATQYKKVRNFYPDNKTNLRTLHYWEGYSWFHGKKYKEAIAAGREAFMLDSTDYATLGLLADASYNNYQYSNAANYYSKCIQYSPHKDEPTKAAVIYFWRGKAYYNSYRYTDAIKDYEKALSMDPKYRNAVREIGTTYDRMSSWKDAISFYTKALSLFNDDAKSMSELFYARGYIYNTQKEIAKALVDYDSAIKRNKQNYSAYYQQSQIYKGQKKYKEALESLQRRIDVDNSVSGKALPLSDRGEIFMLMKDTAKATESFKAAIIANSQLGDPYIGLGDIYFGQKKYSDAIFNYQRGLDDFSYMPDSSVEATIYQRKGLSNYFMGYKYSATADLKECLKYDKNNKLANRYLGEINYVDKLYSTAEDYFTKTIELYKNEKDSLTNMYCYRAMARTGNKKYAAGLEDYKEALKLKPKETGVLYRIGQLEFELKNYTDAITTFNKMLALLKPDNKNDFAIGYYCRGRCYYELNKKVEAKADFTKALEYAPAYAEAKQWLEKTK